VILELLSAPNQGDSLCPSVLADILAPFSDQSISICTYVFLLELTGIRCFLRTSFLDFYDTSKQFISVRFPFNEDAVRILDEQAFGGVNGGVNKVPLFITIYMNMVSVYGGGRHSPTRLVAHRLLDSCSPSGPQAGAGQCGATPSKLL
jgi:hypothetical protein